MTTNTKAGVSNLLLNGADHSMNLVVTANNKLLFVWSLMGQIPVKFNKFFKETIFVAVWECACVWPNQDDSSVLKQTHNI